MDDQFRKSPTPPSEWKSVAQLFREGIGEGKHALRIALEKLREDLTERFLDEGLTGGQASARVQRDFIRQDKRGLYASPEAVALLGVENRPRRAPNGWKTGTELVREGLAKKNACKTIDEIKNLKENLTNDLAEQTTLSQAEAQEVIESNLIGRYRTGYLDREGLYASPDAVRILSDSGVPPPDVPKRGRK
jgi:hypothetical protein